jgi:hypothetical protein
MPPGCGRYAGMNTVIKTIVAVAVAFTVIFYAGAYLLPGQVRVERSLDIAARPEKVFAIAGDLRRWPDWSVWTEVDPKFRVTMEGAASGVGQSLRWASNNPMVGNGVLTVTEHVPPERLAFESSYGDFGTVVSSLAFEGTADGTRVTWRSESPLPGVIDRWAGLFADAAVGKEQEASLARLKDLAEGG